ncbi:hypothetical protein NC653_005655 [Populus alba x Populus x berolinensis]|uniref:Uncharacterized protein n=1 Tax=Populus alba x Populus x berolinensis TaxID=444605 RepID=A0AAD6WDC2_9ROSI|nr:hypothetical protein NC653_005655 [Populus alba x Populus x berolinensis]
MQPPASSGPSLSCTNLSYSFNSASLLSVLSWFLSGLLSVNICQVVKKRMQTGQFASAPDAVHLIVTEEGSKGLYAVCST